MHYHYNGEMNCIRGIWRAHGQKGKLTCYTEDGGPENVFSWRYEGSFDKGQATGQGISYRPDGTKEYEGQWKEGYWQGHGTLFCPDGITHERDWRKGVSHAYEDGSRYEGEWDDDGEQRHGWGIQYRPDGTKEYEGQWEEGYWQGHGTLFCPDGITHERDWRKGVSHAYEDGSRYEGEWDDDGEQRHGWGIQYRPDGTKEYEGQWKEGYWQGHGTLFCPDGITHERDWRKGVSHLYEDGSRYEGEWDDDGEQRHGWGILYDPNLNIVYEGWWQNDDPSDGPPPDRQDTQ